MSSYRGAAHNDRMLKALGVGAPRATHRDMDRLTADLLSSRYRTYNSEKGWVHNPGYGLHEDGRRTLNAKADYDNYLNQLRKDPEMLAAARKATRLGLERQQKVFNREYHARQRPENAQRRQQENAQINTMIQPMSPQAWARTVNTTKQWGDIQPSGFMGGRARSPARSPTRKPAAKKKRATSPGRKKAASPTRNKKKTGRAKRSA